MNQRGKNNSIIFLTTLSVYFGLVLIGGAMPSVLAQAATTRNFNVQDEIEVKDDLDKKPDSDSESLQEIYSDKVFADFVRDLHELQNKKHYKSIEAEDFYSTRRWFVDSDDSFVRESPSLNPSALDKVLLKLLRSLDARQLRILADFSQQEVKFGFYPNAFNLEIYTNVTGVKLDTYFVTSSEQNASLLAGKLNAEFLLKVNKTEDNFAKQIYENTKVQSFNHLVFITTQLPRGSLDALLKQDARAESK